MPRRRRRRLGAGTRAAASPGRGPSGLGPGHRRRWSTVATQGDSVSGAGGIETLVSPGKLFEQRRQLPLACEEQFLVFRAVLQPGRRHRHVLGGRLRRRQLFRPRSDREPVVEQGSRTARAAIRDPPWRSCGWSRRPGARGERRGPSGGSAPRRARPCAAPSPSSPERPGSGLEWPTDDEDHRGAQDGNCAQV